jgi:SpoVK/Ycf46/Vps4 family AAA+-type ATPase
VDLGELAERTEGMVGADIEGICRQAAMLALREFLEEPGSKRAREQESRGAEEQRSKGAGEQGRPLEGLCISRRHFEAVLPAADGR